MYKLQSIAACSGALAVALGAFGAHALKSQLLAAGLLETWHTAVLYHLIHSPMLFIVAMCRPSRARNLASAGFLLGIVLFSGSLYSMCLTGVKALGVITPIGGVLLIGAWIALISARLPSDPD